MTQTDTTGTTVAEPLIVLVGRPNVGKSTLFNRLTGTRRALVAEVPGTTRDRREGEVDDGEWRFRLVDTGGMGFGMGLAFSPEVEAQIGVAVREADYVWVVVDAKEGLNPFDAELHRWVTRQGKPYRVLVNKADNPRRRAGLAEFFALGTERLHAVSAAHGIGLGELLEATAQELPGLRAPPAMVAAVADDETDWDATGSTDASLPAVTSDDGSEASLRAGAPPQALRVAFVGRPNVGKSSLVNRVLGAGRMIVSETAGTTREAIETPFVYKEQDYVLVDTAGIRRRARTHEHLEKLGVLHSLGALNWVHVAVLVVDASEELATQDARIAGYVLDAQRAVVVAMNKWDRLGGDHRRMEAVEADIRHKLRFVEFATFVRTSAHTGAGVEAVFTALQRAAGQYRREIRTADLNRVVQAAALRTPPPAQGRSPTRIYYGAQVGTEPPAFRFFTNHPKQIDDSYTRYFEHQLRHHFGLEGTPVRIGWRSRQRDPAREAGVKGRAQANPTGRVRRARKAPGSAGPAKAPGRRTGGRSQH